MSTDVILASGLPRVSSEHHGYPEAQLVAKAQQGDADAFAELFELHKRRVYSLCLLMTGDAAEAEDSTQDAFVRVFLRLNTFRGDAAFSTWLYRVVVNTVLMKLRKKKLQQVSYNNPVCVDSSEVERDFGSADARLVGVVDRIALTRAIEQLPPGYRTVFILHDVQGYEHHEIARMLRCSLGTSKSQLHKARLRIRELLLSPKGKKTARKVSARQGKAQKDVAAAPVSRPPRASRQTPHHEVSLELAEEKGRAWESGSGELSDSELEGARWSPAR